MDILEEVKRRPLFPLSVYSFIPARRNEPKELSYFYREPKAPGASIYDHVFHQPPGFDMKLQREDRRHYKGRGLAINDEERSRLVPVLSSSIYGHRPVPPMYELGRRKNARVGAVESDFFMKNGITWNTAEGYGSVAPS